MNSILHKNKPAVKPAMLHGKAKPFVQPKLTVNTPGDIYEQEADAMADRVMRISSNETAKPVTGLIGKSLQRKCAHCEEEEKKKKPIMRKAETCNSGMSVSSSFASSLNASKGGGSPLPQGTRSFMENAFSADFSRVRIHNNSKASEMNNDIYANAFTYGSDIYFDSGKYEPVTKKGKYLLAHELTHVIQQKSMPGNIARQPANPNLQEVIPIKLVVFYKEKKIVSLFSSSGTEYRVNFEYDGGINYGVFKYSEGKLAGNLPLGGVPKTVVKDGVTHYWVLRYNIPYDEKLEKIPNYTLVVVDNRLLSDSSNAKLKLSMNELAELTQMTAALDDVDIRRLKSFQGGGLAKSFAEVKEKVLSYKEGLRDYEVMQLEQTKTATKLFGLMHAYSLYKEYVSFDINRLMKKMANPVAMAKDVISPIDQEQEKLVLKNRLELELKQNGIKSIEEFSSLISEFEQTFRELSLNIALRALERMKYQSNAEIKKFKSDKNYEKMFDELSEARTVYKEGKQEFAESVLGSDDSSKGLLRASADGKFAQSKKHFEKTMAKHPLLMLFQNEQGEILERDKKYFSNQGYFTTHIYEKIGSMAIAMDAIKRKPELIYKLDALLDLSYTHFGIKKDSILDLIVKDKIKQIEDDDGLVDKLILIVSIALIPFTFGASAAVIPAQLGLAALSLISAERAITEYNLKNTMFNAGVLTQEPSAFWVVLAVAGAGLDLGSVASAVGKTAQIAKKYGTFAESGSEAFLKELKNAKLIENSTLAAEEVIRIEAKLKETVKLKLKAVKDLDEAFNTLFKKYGSRINSAMGAADPRILLDLVALAKRCINRGYYSFEEYLLFLKRNRIIKNLDNLTNEERILFKQAFEDSLDETAFELNQLDEMGGSGANLDYVGQMSDEIEALGAGVSEARFTGSELVGVKPTARGFAIEDELISLLNSSGWQGLPDRFPGIDAYLGGVVKPIKIKGKIVKSIEGAYVLSVKSTKITDMGTLEAKIQKDLAALRPASFRNGEMVLSKVKSKKLTLVFEQGFLGKATNPDIVKMLERFGKQRGVKFEWYYIASNGELFNGENFIDSMKLIGE
jgi:Domain of unknown function (DUF4157)